MTRFEKISAHAKSTAAVAVVAVLAVAAAGCAVGPDYRRPAAPLADDWMEAGVEPAVSREPASYADWWKLFNDPVLNSLVQSAYTQNPTLRSAGARVLEAIARRNVAFGTLFPQQQEAFGSYNTSRNSENAAGGSVPGFKHVDDWQVGFDAAWELDVWGRLRRGVEAADAAVLASVATYDDVLVSLIAEVARNYILVRTFEERLIVAEANVGVQQDSYDIASARFRSGAVSQLDAAQASSLLDDTRASIPALQAAVKFAENTLSVLLGMPPHDLGNVLGAGPREIPHPPSAIAVGVPAELLRQRPDVRRAERVLAAQSASIGIAKADLLPTFFLSGTIELQAEDAADLFKGDSFEAFGGPSFRWAILNYGRITNNVRVQDARYQALVGEYEDTVLRAQADVENAIANFIGAQSRLDFLSQSVEAAQRAVDVAYTQYREGATDYTRVLNTQQFLVDVQDRLVNTKGDLALSIAALYKALGGGWELRGNDPFVTPAQAEQMRERTWWGGLLDASLPTTAPGEAAPAESPEVAPTAEPAPAPQPAPPAEPLSEKSTESPVSTALYGRAHPQR
jgi:NodT family efflux transporter outer membrane factor (OMF) lipoprotein